MSDEHKIYDVFRRNEYKLAEKPSPRAWERVDARLDQHYQRQGRSLWRYGSMAAACVLLLGVAGLLAWDGRLWREAAPMADHPEPVLLASAELEDLSTTADIHQYQRMVAYQMEYQKLQDRMEEAAISGSLAPSREMAAKAKDAPFVPATEELAKDAAANATTPVDAAVTLRETQAEEVAAPAPQGEEQEIASLPVHDEMATVVTEKPSPTQTAAAIPTPADASLAAREDAQPRASVSVATDELLMNELHEETGFGMDAKAHPLQLEGFAWLLGNWSGESPNGISKETWTQVDQATMLGKAQLQVGKATLMTEQLEIRQTASGVYLTLSLGGKEPQAYRMVSRVGGRAVFSNPDVGFPQEVVLEQKGQSFSLLMQQGDRSQLGQAQWTYLQQRNTAVKGDVLQRKLSQKN